MRHPQDADQRCRQGRQQGNRVSGDSRKQQIGSSDGVMVVGKMSPCILISWVPRVQIHLPTTLLLKLELLLMLLTLLMLLVM